MKTQGVATDKRNYIVSGALVVLALAFAILTVIALVLDESDLAFAWSSGFLWTLIALTIYTWSPIRRTVGNIPNDSRK